MMAEQEKIISETQEKLEKDLEELCKNELREDKAIDSLEEYEGVMKYIFRVGIAFLCTRGVSAVDISKDNEQVYFEAVHKMKKDVLVRTLAREEVLSNTIRVHCGALFKVEKCSDEKAFAKTAVNYLLMATQGLIRLTLSMSTIATLWEQVHLCCKSLAVNSIQECVEGAMNYEMEKRLQLWTSQAFKTQAVQNYAHWVAFKMFCQDGAKAITKSNRKLMELAIDTPNYEKAKAKITDKAVAEELNSNILQNLGELNIVTKIE
jgi:hypothetical protein